MPQQPLGTQSESATQARPGLGGRGSSRIEPHPATAIDNTIDSRSESARIQFLRDYRFMPPRNSMFPLVGRMCFSVNSIASIGVNGCSTWRSAVMRTRSA